MQLLETADVTSRVHALDIQRVARAVCLCAADNLVCDRRAVNIDRVVLRRRTVAARNGVDGSMIDTDRVARCFARSLAADNIMHVLLNRDFVARRLAARDIGQTAVHCAANRRRPANRDLIQRAVLLLGAVCRRTRAACPAAVHIRIRAAVNRNDIVRCCIANDRASAPRIHPIRLRCARSLEDQPRIVDFLVVAAFAQRHLCSIARRYDRGHAVADGDATGCIVLDQRAGGRIRRAMNRNIAETPKLCPHRIPQRQFWLKRIRKVEIDLVEIDDVLRTRTRLDIERIARIGGTVSAERAEDVLCDLSVCRQLVFPVAEIDDIVLDLTVAVGSCRIHGALYLAARDGDDIPRQLSAAAHETTEDIFDLAPRNGDFVVHHTARGVCFFDCTAVDLTLQYAALDHHRIVRHVPRRACLIKHTTVDLAVNRPSVNADMISQNMPRRIRTAGNTAIQRRGLAAVDLNKIVLCISAASDLSADHPLCKGYRSRIKIDLVSRCVPRAPRETSINGGNLRCSPLNAHRVVVRISCTSGSTAIGSSAYFAIVDCDRVMLGFPRIRIRIAAIDLIRTRTGTAEGHFVVIAAVLIRRVRTRAARPATVDIRVRAAVHGNHIMMRRVAEDGATAPCVFVCPLRNGCRCVLMRKRIALVGNLLAVCGFRKDKFPVLVHLGLGQTILTIRDGNAVRILNQRPLMVVRALHREFAEASDRRPTGI